MYNFAEIPTGSQRNYQTNGKQLQFAKSCAGKSILAIDTMSSHYTVHYISSDLLKRQNETPKTRMKIVDNIMVT